MFFLNEHEVESLADEFNVDEFPNLARGAQTLNALMNWTNSNSDGWPHWTKPMKASGNLAAMLVERQRDYAAEDLTASELNALYRPVKSFLTQQGIAHSEIIA